ncbi:MAG: hypothetical protein EKK57_03960 [Proteobacteria bacterium]|nr:MAG: hypothetical protein EKK57_03960 [Pseudomonadota bacterium]
MKRITLLVLAMWMMKSTLSFAVSIAQPVLFDPGMEQHGSFFAEDLRTSPLLRSMFNLSVNDVNSDLVRICITQQNDCRVVHRSDKVYLVSRDGRVKFDDSVN